MPITLDKKLPAVDILRSENIFVMDDIRATHQDIRPMNVLILNLMPTKVATDSTVTPPGQYSLADQCGFPLYDKP